MSVKAKFPDFCGLASNRLPTLVLKERSLKPFLFVFLLVLSLSWDNAPTCWFLSSYMNSCNILPRISFRKSPFFSSASYKIACIDLLFSWVILNFTSLMVLVYFIMEVLDGPFQVIWTYFYRKYSTHSGERLFRKLIIIQIT